MKTSTKQQIRTDFSIEAEWAQGFTGKLELTNLGANFTDWTIEFTSQVEIDPEKIWGAKIVSHTGDRYTLKPVDYNQTIDTQKSTSIVFNGNKVNGKILEPQAITLVDVEVDQGETMPAEDSSPVENPSPAEPIIEPSPSEISGNQTELSTLSTEPTNDLPAEVNFSLIKDWGSGFQGEISITNNSDLNIDSWNLEFDFPNQINNIWDAAIEEKRTGADSGFA